MLSIRRMIICALMAIAMPLSVSSVWAQDDDDTLIYATYEDIKDWDPAIGFSLEIVMLANVYEPLVWYNPPGSEQILSPALATEWSSNDEGTEWIFKCKVKSEMVNEEQRVKTSVYALEPIDYVQESENMLKALEKWA